MNQNATTTLDSVREMTHYALANNVADIAGPDSEDSPGAKFLTGVRDSVIETLEWNVENDDMSLGLAARRLREDAHELADGAVPVYTYERWLTFVDLCAWQVDIDDYGSSEDMTTQAGVALYEVARLLVDALCEYVETYWSELVEEGDITDDDGQDEDTDEELDSGSGE